MLIVVLFCWILGLAIALNEHGYNDIVPSILFGEYHSPPQCPEGYSGQHPNCVTSYVSQNLSPLSEYLPTTPPPPPPPNKYIPPSVQCPPGSVGQIPFCKILDRKYVPPTQDTQHPQTYIIPQNNAPPAQSAIIQIVKNHLLRHLRPFGSVGQFPNCEIQLDPAPLHQCPPGTIGYYPNCELETPPSITPIPQCPFGFFGQFPDCQLETPPSITRIQQCPFGSVGQFPDCQPSPQNCPTGMIGHYPFCISPPPSTTTKPTTTKPTPTPRQPPECPLGTIGKFPNCKEPQPSRIYLTGPDTGPIDPVNKPPLSSCIIGWDDYKTHFNKSYNTHQDIHRRVLFEEDQKIIEAHNALYEQGKETYSLCVNEYSDWTMHEYERILGIDYTELPFEPDIPDYSNNSKNPNKEMGYIYEGPQPKPSPQSAFSGGGVEEGLGSTGLGTIADEWDWRNFSAVTPVKNQGTCASCWAFSATGALESHFFIKQEKRGQPIPLKPLSEQQLIDCTKRLGNNGCYKGFMHKAFEYTQHNGIGAETEYPYAATDGASCRAASNDLKNIYYQNITRGDEVLLKEKVFMGPVSAGMDARKMFKRLGFHGVYNYNECTGINNHAVLIVGYGHDKELDLPYWIIKNSFGTGWGDKGFARILRGRNHCGIASLLSYPVV